MKPCANSRCRRDFHGRRGQIFCSNACRVAEFRRQNCQQSPLLQKIDFYEKLLSDVVFSPEQTS